MFDNIIKILSEYTNDFSGLGIFKLIVDVLLVCTTIVLLYFFIRKKTNPYKILLVIGIFILLYIGTVIFDLRLFQKIITTLSFWSIGILIVVYSQEIKHEFDAIFSNNKVNNVLPSKQEKQEIINCLCNTVTYLSERRIGALITIERDDSLSSFIEKAIPINSVITQEILTTIFTPGTACHDGAIIIRGNRIMCAGAYYPSTDKYDVPKFLGTRHRAAIGISERYDALTIVVSEETGTISITLSGVITLELTKERLEEILDRYLVVR